MGHNVTYIPGDKSRQRENNIHVTETKKEVKTETEKKVILPDTSTLFSTKRTPSRNRGSQNRDKQESHTPRYKLRQATMAKQGIKR